MGVEQGFYNFGYDHPGKQLKEQEAWLIPDKKYLDAFYAWQNDAQKHAPRNKNYKIKNHND